jgi:NhaP-type Na+/H+ or K+/H+ antiporter
VIVYGAFSRLAEQSVITPPMIFMSAGILVSPIGLGLLHVPATVSHWSVTTTVYAVLSLTVARMLPVAISLIGMGIDLRTQLFIGWFGPRGIASILYLLMIVKFLGTTGYETLIATGVQTVTLSVLLHGLTAAPLASAYGRWKSAHPSK